MLEPEREALGRKGERWKGGCRASWVAEAEQGALAADRLICSPSNLKSKLLCIL